MGAHPHMMTRIVAAVWLLVAAPSLPFERWMSLMAQDKKVAEGAIRFILLEALGWAVIAGDVARDDLAAVLA